MQFCFSLWKKAHKIINFPISKFLSLTTFEKSWSLRTVSLNPVWWSMPIIQALRSLRLKKKKKVQVQSQNELSSESQDNLGSLPTSTHTENDQNKQKLQLSAYHPWGKKDSVELLENQSVQFSVFEFNILR